MRYYGVQNEVKSYLNRLQSEAGLQVSVSTVKTLNDRVESLKKSGVWSQYGLGFNDADADRYFQRASVNNVLGRFEVCLFVRGMKTLGLWQNMVSWPMRSYQNIGTGSTVYSLGGLGTFDGTLFNSAAWSNQSIVGNNIDDYMAVNNFSSTSITPSFLMVYNRSRNLTEQTRPLIGNWFNPVGWPIMFGMEWFGQARSYMHGRDIVTNSLNGAATFQNGFHSRLGYNSVSVEVAGAAAPVLKPFNVYENTTLHGNLDQYGAPDLPFDAAPATVNSFPCFFGTLEISLLLFVNGRNAQNARQLYKLTLGSSLELP